MKHWHTIQQQPRVAHIFNQPAIVSYRKEKSLKDRNHKKVVNKEALSRGLFSNQKEIYIRTSASNTLSLRSPIWVTATQQSKQN